MGFTQGTGTSYSSTTTSYTATGLTQNTYYDAYVMSNCTSTGDGTSNWVGPFTFKTECGDQANPYSTGFEGYTDGSTSNPDLPDCWAYAKQVHHLRSMPTTTTTHSTPIMVLMLYVSTDTLVPRQPTVLTEIL